MSNKTQLTTNNEQLASLISTLQGKAAGGGGSGQQVARGTFTITDNVYGASLDIAVVEGLGFTPIYVLIVTKFNAYMSISSGSTINGSTVYPRFITFCENDGETIRTGYAYKTYLDGRGTGGAYGTILFDSDGFTFRTGTNTTSGAHKTAIYHWVAIG